MTTIDEQQEINHMQELLRFGLGLKDGWFWKMGSQEIDGRKKMLANFILMITQPILQQAAQLVLDEINQHIETYDALDEGFFVQILCTIDTIQIGTEGYLLTRYCSQGHQVAMVVFQGPVFAKRIPIIYLQQIPSVDKTIENLNWLQETITEEMIPDEYELKEVINLIRRAISRLHR